MNFYKVTIQTRKGNEFNCRIFAKNMIQAVQIIHGMKWQVRTFGQNFQYDANAIISLRFVEDGAKFKVE